MATTPLLRSNHLFSLSPFNTGWLDNSFSHPTKAAWTPLFHPMLTLCPPLFPDAAKKFFSACARGELDLLRPSRFASPMEICRFQQICMPPSLLVPTSPPRRAVAAAPPRRGGFFMLLRRRGRACFRRTSRVGVTPLFRLVVERVWTPLFHPDPTARRPASFTSA